MIILIGLNERNFINNRNTKRKTSIMEVFLDLNDLKS